MSELIRIVRDSLGFIENSGFETEAEIFAQPCADIAFALRLKKIVKCAHLRFVIGAGANLLRSRQAQLAITWIGVAQRRKCGHHAGDHGILDRLTLRVTDRVRAGFLRAQPGCVPRFPDPAGNDIGAGLALRAAATKNAHNQFAGVPNVSVRCRLPCAKEKCCSMRASTARYASCR